MVGYQPGYGEAADCWPQGANSSYLKMRVIVMVAVKNDVALVAAAVGPFRQFGPDFGSGKPSAASLQIALDMGKYVNSLSGRGAPPRKPGRAGQAVAADPGDVGKQAPQPVPPAMQPRHHRPDRGVG